jgi:hypothetical protein
MLKITTHATILYINCQVENKVFRLNNLWALSNSFANNRKQRGRAHSVAAQFSEVRSQFAVADSRFIIYDVHPNDMVVPALELHRPLVNFRASKAQREGRLSALTVAGRGKLVELAAVGPPGVFV